MTFRAVEWVGGTDGRLRVLDQTRLPDEERQVSLGAVEEVFEAIRSLRVRGAPLIGIAAAYGVVLGLREGPGAPEERARRAAARLRRSRPTAVNLFHALERMERRAGSLRGTAPEAFHAALLAEARSIADEDRGLCARIAEVGAPLIPAEGGVLTYCNTGALATGGVGTALGVILHAWELGRRPKVYACETRPLLQGARLTAWELRRRGIEPVLLCDNAAAELMRQRKLALAIVGADRIARNGDAANKVGTLGLALAAREFGVPFYVAAPTTTLDAESASGGAIPIEERAAEEVTAPFGRALAPAGAPAFNPAFDVTPGRLIAGIVTEHGVLRPPYGETIPAALNPERGPGR